MDATQLIRLQLVMECIGFDLQGLLIRIPGPNPDDIARVCVYRHDRGYSLYFRQDLPPAFREQIQAQGPQAAFDNPDAVKAILGARGSVEQGFAGQTYQFPDTLDPSLYPDVVRLTGKDRPRAAIDDRPIYAIVRDGSTVSTCVSARESAQAAEAYVHTEAEYRRRGFGRQVTAAWAVHVRARGKIPLYSHTWANTASEGVARGLNLLPRFACRSYS